MSDRQLLKTLRRQMRTFTPDPSEFVRPTVVEEAPLPLPAPCPVPPPGGWPDDAGWPEAAAEHFAQAGEEPQ